MISVVIADKDRDFTKEISWALRDVPDVELSLTTDETAELEPLILTHKADVLLIGPTWKKKNILDSIVPLLKKVDSLQVVCSLRFCESEEPAKQGVDNQRIRTLSLPASRQEIIEIIKQSHAYSKTRAETCSKNPDASVPEKKTETIKPVDKKKKSKGKLMTVFSTKGGVGKTAIATNLAVCMAQRFRSSVVILDLDFQFGDVGVMLKLQPQHTVYDAALMSDTLDVKTLASFFTVNGTGVKALLAPLEPELADLIAGSSTEKIVKLSRELGSYVIIDTPPSFNDNVLAALEESDQIYLVGTMDVPSIKNLKLCLHTLQLLGYPKEKSELIINRMQRHSGLSIDEIEKALETKALLTIPQDRLVPVSVNKGIPVVLNAPKAPFSKSIYQLSRILENPRRKSA